MLKSSTKEKYYIKDNVSFYIIVIEVSKGVYPFVVLKKQKIK